MANIWVVVAESSRAKIFTMNTPDGALNLKETFEHPEARQHEQFLVSDLPGRTFDSAGQGRHAKEEEVGPKKQEAIRFAKEITDYLEQARTRNEIERLVLVAPPQFLGLLRDSLSAKSAALVSQEIHKDLVKLDPLDTRRHLPARL